MKYTGYITTVFVLASLNAVPGWAQEKSGNAVTIELTRPGEPCHVTCGLVYGGILVEAHTGKTVIVETRTEASAEDLEKLETRGEHEKPERTRERDLPAGDLRRIPVASSSLEVVEKDNLVEIDPGLGNKLTDVWIRVPANTSVSLSCVNDGDIRVVGVSGVLEVENVNGAVTLERVSGAAVAYTTNGDVTVDLREVEPGKPMSFASFNGDVTVTLPAATRATFKIKTQQGDAYTDFEVLPSRRPSQTVEEGAREDDGTYRVSVEEAYYGDVNGGGPEFSFSTFNGDIVIRKGP